MSNEVKSHSPQHEELLKQQELEQHEVKEVLQFLRKYAKQGAILLGAVVVVSLAVRINAVKQLEKAQAADLMLMNAKSAADFQKVSAEYASTLAATIADMTLAKDKFNAGQFAEAEAIYEGVLKSAKSADAQLLAELNIITCKEAVGQLDEAIGQYDAFAAANKDSYLAHAAIMNKARCLEEQGKTAEAKVVYEDLLADESASVWQQIIDGRMQALK